MAQLIPYIVLALGVVAVLGLIVGLVRTRFVQCPSNKLMVVCGQTPMALVRGLNTAAKVLHGGTVFVWPLQQYRFIDLATMHTMISLPPIESTDDFGFEVPLRYHFAVGTAPKTMQYAAICLMGLPVEEIEGLAAEIIRTEVAQLLRGSDGLRDEVEFRDALELALEPTLESKGLVLVGIGDK